MKVFITGITGTIGRAFADFLDCEITGIDHNENAVKRFVEDYPNINIKTGDFGDCDLGGDVLIHLAAMKHLDLCEANPNACVKNNLIQTYKLFRQAKDLGIDVIFMSTDKANQPTSVYGYTKLLAEKMAQEYGFTVVRSGNIYGSSGSVIEIWERAIASGKPLVITDPDAERYFIYREHLVKSIWEGYLNGEKLIIPKMDIKIKIKNLADRVLAEHGLSDYPIEFIGLRKGEKLKEIL